MIADTTVNASTVQNKTLANDAYSQENETWNGFIYLHPQRENTEESMMHSPISKLKIEPGSMFNRVKHQNFT